MQTEKRTDDGVLPVQRGEIDDLTLARACSGDNAALAALVDCYQRRVYALIGRMLVDRPQLVEDLAQDVFLKVFGGLPRFDVKGPARLSTWILIVATRTCLDVLRAKRRVTEEISASLPSPSDPEAETAQRQMGRRVQAAMTRLPEDMRVVVILRAYHDFDYAEIATALGLELGTVKSRLGRARSVLREAIEGVP